MYIMSDKIIFSGDLYCPENFCEFSLGNNAMKIIENSKYHCTNFEAPWPCQSDGLSLKAGPKLEQSIEIQKVLKLLKITHICLANNHIFDNGISGFIKTTESLIDYAVLGAGLTQEKIFAPSVLNIDGKKVALINASERQFGCYPHNLHTAGYAHFLDERFLNQIEYCSSNYHKTVVVVHGGLEMVDIPLPQIRNLYKSYIDAGASAVIGHHPHVIQGKELYNGSWIYYSIGNFIFRSEIESGGGVLKMNIGKDGNLQFTEYKVKVYKNNIELEEFEFKDSTDYLKSKSYETDAKKICTEYYEKCLNPYLNEVTFGLQNIYKPKRIIQLFKLFIKSALGRSTSVTRSMLLYHLLSFDTNRWTIETALKNKIHNKQTKE